MNSSVTHVNTDKKSNVIYAGFTILREIQNMSALHSKQSKSSPNRSDLNVISKNKQQINKRHNEIVKIFTNTLPSEMYNNLSNAIESMNNWHKFNETKQSIITAK